MNGFQKFLLRGNVVDLAIAVVIGAAFGAIVTAFVAAFVTPLVGVVTGASGDVSDRSFTLGGVEFPYGLFLQALISFVLVAAVIYFLVLQPVNRLMERYKTEPEVQSTTKQCPECLSNIPSAATRCAFCTVQQVTAPPPPIQLPTPGPAPPA
ncbi:MAG: large conductance mechanosensitive channel protein MscL [Actinobacteria bacterium]|nr:large conductance mechanosensitive channel protein MscL [Actinomycetota bacterium]